MEPENHWFVEEAGFPKDLFPVPFYVHLSACQNAPQKASDLHPIDPADPLNLQTKRLILQLADQGDLWIHLWLFA